MYRVKIGKLIDGNHPIKRCFEHSKSSEYCRNTHHFNNVFLGVQYIAQPVVVKRDHVVLMKSLALFNCLSRKSEKQQHKMLSFTVHRMATKRVLFQSDVNTKVHKHINQ